MSRNLNVLVVDDEAPARELLCLQIERSYPSLNVVQTASSAKEARRLINTISPDVVFVDLRIPNESGLDLIGRYKNRDLSMLSLLQPIKNIQWKP